MFKDLGELEYVLYLLDQLAANPNSRDRVTYRGVITAIDGVASKVHSREVNHQIKPGQSRQSKIIADLYYLLESSNRVDKLGANLEAIKNGIRGVYAICLDDNVTELNIEVAGLKPMAELGISRSSQVKNWAARGASSVKKHTDDAHQSWLKQATELIEKNNKLRVRGIARIISKTDTNNPPSETVRKYLSKYWVNPSNLPT